MATTSGDNENVRAKVLEKKSNQAVTACYKTLLNCQPNLPLGREGLTVVVQREFVVQLPMRPPYYSAHVVRPDPKADFLMYLGCCHR